MTRPYTLIGSRISLYSGKTRSYLTHKGIPFVEKGPDAWTVFMRIPRRTGAFAIPVLVTPHGEWIQDTSVICDRLERDFPEPAIVPPTPRLGFAAYLLELWGDEFWLPIAMHTRWSHPENRPRFLNELGADLLPGLPRFAQHGLAAHFARKMRAHTPRLGINPQGVPLLDRWMKEQLDALDAHFAQHRFMLGTRPSLADYGLYAPLYAHVALDPWSGRTQIEPRKSLGLWLERMTGKLAAPGEWAADDQVPATLIPALRSICDEMLPYYRATLAELRASTPGPGGRILRFLNEVDYPYAGGTHRRRAIPYGLWMVQRMLDWFASRPATEQAAIRDWLREIGGQGWLELDLPRLRRDGLGVALATRP
jgi:glutathione S-transferase